jgi:hypothetical protein
MSCFWTSSQVAAAPLADPVSQKKEAPAKSKAVEEVPAKEETHKSDGHQKKSSSGGSQAHAFVRHLIHNADSR